MPMIFGLINFVSIDSLINKSKLVLPVAITLKSSGSIVQDWLWFLMLLNGGHDNGKLVFYDKSRCIHLYKSVLRQGGKR